MEIGGIILAAGKGTRFKSEKPKVVHKILGLPMAYYPYEALVKSLNPKKVAFIVGHKKEIVVKEFKNLPNVLFFEQENPKGGTADAVLKAMPLLKELGRGYVAILNGDSPLIRPQTLKRGFEKVREENLAGLIFTTILETPTGYGRIVRDAEGKVAKIVEEKDATSEEKKIKEVNGGIYIFKANLLAEVLKEIKPSPVTGELYLTDAVSLMYRRGWKIDTFPTDRQELLGVNDRLQLAQAEKILLKRKIESLQRKGVTIRLPETVYIEWEVEVEPDTEIEPSVSLRGKTKIGKNSLIGQGSVIENSLIGEKVKVLPYSYISDSVVEEGALIGPYARLRNETHVKEGAEIGNFVEVKKSTLGQNTKAKHLTYIGDTILGKNCNVGAGTVFANYDGRKKAQTYVGNNVFIGSNSLIIAPRLLEDWSFIAGGSVVNKNVPGGALAIGRAKLKILEGKNPLLEIKKEKNRD